MIVVRNSLELRRIIDEEKRLGKSVGFVPTMGFLHEGHVSLIELAIRDGHYSVCSIFVNPTQFNDPKDLARYPRNEERDLEILKKAGCQLVFIPAVNDIYPETSNFSVDLGAVANVLEGQFRPGHFLGVAQVVSILFKRVNPDVAYFGDKDFQQVLVIEKMCEILNLNVTIKRGKIIRESDGLAMSSRNSLLSKEERKEAAQISKWLQQAADRIKTQGVEALDLIRDEIKKKSIFRLEYLVYCKRKDLSEMKTFEEGQGVLLIATFCGKIRLIDNLPI